MQISNVKKKYKDILTGNRYYELTPESQTASSAVLLARKFYKTG